MMCNEEVIAKKVPCLSKNISDVIVGMRWITLELSFCAVFCHVQKYVDISLFYVICYDIMDEWSITCKDVMAVEKLLDGVCNLYLLSTQLSST